MATHPMAGAAAALGLVLAVGLAVGLAACTQGPDFVAPAAPAEHGYLGPNEPARTPGGPAPAQRVALGAKVAQDWWTLFRSPELDRIVKQALADSPTVAAAQATLEQAREQTAATAGGLLPQIDANAGISRQKVNVQISGSSLPSRVLNVFEIGPSVSYDFDVFGATKREVEAQSARADVSQYQLAAAYLSLTGNVTLQALTIAAVRAEIKTVGDILADDQKNLDLVKTEQAAGAVTLVDVTAAQSQLANDRTLLPPLRQQLSVAEHALSVYAGRSPADWTPPDFDIATLVLPKDLPLSLPSALVRQRPDILAAEARLHVASAEIGVATANLYPKITLTAAIEQAATRPGLLFSGVYNGFDIGPGLAAPLFHGGTLQAERRAALDAYKVAFANYRQTVIQSFGQVADVLQALAHDDDQVAAQSAALATAVQALRLARLSYAAGNSSVLQVLDTERLSEQARLGVVRAEAQRYLDTAQLFVALGSGWWNTPPPEPAAEPTTAAAR